MLCRMAIKNIKKSIRDYAIYFFTLVIGVSVFYVFNAIEDQTSYMVISKDTREMARILGTVLSGLSVFVAVVLGLLVVFASRFLMKRRNKEFATYLLLGMSKGSIAGIMFFETVIIGLISLVFGLLIGTGLSQLMSALVANLFEADMTSFRFMVSSGAIVKTIINFAVIYIIVIIFDTFMVGKTNLINLMQSAKKSEKVRLKNPALCVIIFVAAATVLGFAYHIVLNLDLGLSGRDALFKFSGAIVLGAVSTFFIFWSVSGLLLRLLMSFKKRYFRRLNCFTMRQLSSSVNTMVVSMTIICLLLFFTICGLSAAFSLRNSINSTLRENANVDWSQAIYVDEGLIDAMDGSTGRIYVVDENGNVDVRELDTDSFAGKTPYEIWQNAGESSDESMSFVTEYVKKANNRDFFEKYGPEYMDCLSEYAIVSVYYAPGLTPKEVMGPGYDKLMKDNPNAELSADYEIDHERIVKVSEYNRMAKLRNYPTVELSEDEYAVVANYRQIIGYRNIGLRSGQSIEVYGKTLKPKYNKCVKGGMNMSSSSEDGGFIVVPDSVIEAAGDKAMLCRKALYGNYNLSGMTKAEMDEKITDIVNGYRPDHNDADYMNIENGHFSATRTEIVENSIGFTAISTFLFLYLGIIFLITSAVILALKALSDSADSIERYEMLRKIGVDEKDIRGSLFRQQGMFFVLPLLLALFHSIFGIRFINKTLIVFSDTHILSAIVATSGIIIFIYGGYFLITYLYSRQIIKGKNTLKNPL